MTMIDGGLGSCVARAARASARTVLIVAPGHEERSGRRRQGRAGGCQPGVASGRGDQREPSQAARSPAATRRRHGRAERVAGQGQGCGGRKPLAKVGQGGADVVLLAPALVPGAGRERPTPRKLKRRVARPCAGAGLGRRGDDGAVHVAPVPGVRVAEDDTHRAGFRRQGQGSLQGRAGCNGNQSRTVRLSSGPENNGGGRVRPTDVLTCYRTRRRLGAYLDGALDQETARSASTHLASCGGCQREVGELRRLHGLLRSNLTPASPTGRDSGRAWCAASRTSARPGRYRRGRGWWPATLGRSLGVGWRAGRGAAAHVDRRLAVTRGVRLPRPACS